MHSFRGRKCTHKHSQEGSEHTSIQRKEVHAHAFKGRKCTNRLSEEVHTHVLRGERCTQRAPRMEVNASTTTKRREVQAHALRAESCTHTPQEGKTCAMRRDWSSICPTNAVPQVRRCSTCSEGGDATYV